MKIRVGYEMVYDFPKPTPMIMVLGTHFTRASDIIVPDFLSVRPATLRVARIGWRERGLAERGLKDAGVL